MAEESTTVMLMPEDETEAILEKVRMAGAKKVNLIVPPGTRALQTLGGFTTLRKACDITGIDVTVYSQDEKTRDMATVCRFEVVSLDQDVRPRPAAPPEEPPRIVISTRPPEPGGARVEAAAAEELPEGIKERLGELSADDLALFDALEGMSTDQDVELRADSFGRPTATPVVVEPVVVEETPARPPKAKKPKKPSPLRVIIDPLTSALGNVYIAVVGLFLRIAQRSMQKEEKTASGEAPAAIAPQVRTEDEARILRQRKLRYSLWALVGVVVCTILILGLYALFQPIVTVSLTPREAETREMDLDVAVVITDTVDPKGGVNSVDGGVSVQAQQFQVELQGWAFLPASGQSTIPEGSATGAVILVNVTSYAVNVPAGTRVAVAGGGISFHTTQDVWVPASDFRGADAYLGKAQVNIVADMPGSAGNVAPASISVLDGDLSGVLTVENAESTSGGSERQAHIVTPEDQEALRQQLVTGLRSDAYAQLQSQMPGLQVLSGTLSVETVEETFSHAVGSEAISLTLTAKVRASALAVAPGALDTAVRQVVEGQVETQKGQVIGSIRTGAVQPVAPGTGINTWVYRTHVTVPILNTIDDQLKSEIAGKLRGKTPAQITQIEQEYSDRIATFAISPVLPKMPGWGRIQVVDVSVTPK